MTRPSCGCGLHPECLHPGTPEADTLSCPEWVAHVRPSLLERIAGFFAAIFGGRW